MSWGKLGFNEGHTASSLVWKYRKLLSEKKKCNINSCQMGVTFITLEEMYKYFLGIVSISSLEYIVGLSKFSLRIISRRGLQSRHI